jgi:hypothetical protein
MTDEGRCGAVALVKHIANPARLAQQVGGKQIRSKRLPWIYVRVVFLLQVPRQYHKLSSFFTLLQHITQ